MGERSPVYTYQFPVTCTVETQQEPDGKWLALAVFPGGKKSGMVTNYETEAAAVQAVLEWAAHSGRSL